MTCRIFYHPIFSALVIATIYMTPSYSASPQGAPLMAVSESMRSFSAALMVPVQVDSQEGVFNSVFVGGDGGDEIHDIAVHPISGDIYVVGETSSTTLSSGASKGVSYRGDYRDAFVARLDSELGAIKRVAYLGGEGSDEAYSIAVSSTTGDVYVVGETGSDDFPKTNVGAQSHTGGLGDFFVARLNSDLTKLYTASFLGGGDLEYQPTIAIHPESNEVYIIGTTLSNDFPGTLGGAQEATIEPDFISGHNGIVIKLNENLTEILRASYLSGIRKDEARTLAIDAPAGRIYVAGISASSDFLRSADFSETETTELSCASELKGGFIVGLNMQLTSFKKYDCYSIGFTSLVVDSASDTLYAAGAALRDVLPITNGGAQPNRAGFGDGIVARLDRQSLTVLQASYFGGGLSDVAKELAIHPDNGNVYLVGETDSRLLPGTSFGFQAEPGEADFSVTIDSYDFFIARFNPSLTSLRQATYFGGGYREAEASTAIHPTSGELFVSGLTISPDLPGTFEGSFPGPELVSNGFISRLSSDLGSIIRPIVDATFDGSWFNPNRSGEGFIFEILKLEGRSYLVTYFFTYVNGKGIWFTGLAPLIGQTAVFNLVITYTTELGTFNRFQPDEVERTDFGRMSVRFDSCTSAQVNVFTLREGFISLPIIRFTPVMPGLTGRCGSDATPTVETSLFGTWFNPSRSGEGFIFDLAMLEDKTWLVVYWFTFDTVRGQLAWFHGMGAIENGVADISLVRLRGASFGPDFDPEDIERRPWGNLRVEFLDCSSGHISYDGANGFEPIRYDITRLTPPPHGGDAVCKIP